LLQTTSSMLIMEQLQYDKVLADAWCGARFRKETLNSISHRVEVLAACIIQLINSIHMSSESTIRTSITSTRLQVYLIENVYYISKYAGWKSNKNR